MDLNPNFLLPSVSSSFSLFVSIHIHTKGNGQISVEIGWGLDPVLLSNCIRYFGEACVILKGTCNRNQ